MEKFWCISWKVLFFERILFHVCLFYLYLLYFSSMKRKNNKILVTYISCMPQAYIVLFTSYLHVLCISVNGKILRFAIAWQCKIYIYTCLICLDSFLSLRFEPWRFDVNSSNESLHVSPEIANYKTREKSQILYINVTFCTCFN